MIKLWVAITTAALLVSFVVGTFFWVHTGSWWLGMLASGVTAIPFYWVTKKAYEDQDSLKQYYEAQR